METLEERNPMENGTHDARTDEAAVEAALIDAAVAGDDAALERLLMRSHRRLAAHLESKMPRALRRLLNVEDILQDTYLTVFQKIGDYRYRGHGSFFRWLATVGDSRLIDTIKSERTTKRGGDYRRVENATSPKTGSVVEFLDLLSTDERTPSGDAAGHEARHCVQAALNDLKEDHREVLQLRYLEGLPVREVAERMHRSEGAVCLLCHRALKRLQELLGTSTRFFSRGA